MISYEYMFKINRASLRQIVLLVIVSTKKLQDAVRGKQT